MIQPFTDMRTITEAVGKAMLVSDSQERKDELSAVLGFEPEFLARARTDVDGVIALVDNVEANALVPALNFHFANHLPVYASSQVTRRTRSGQLDELSGFHVSELPWFLEGNDLYALLNDPLSLDTNPFASLIALGADAFQVAERVGLLESLGDFRMLGSTGFLTLQSDGRITRELAWGRITGARVSADIGGGP
jgi:outer membrane PBP1 activator LpoA protein